MTDRIDIDALLIGALYGELTPADEARLAAHLESHPADRTALAELTRTRAALRDSRILAHQVEPPQAVSALLLQEAARRAPRPQRESEGWFHRLARSLMAHPAIAAAATFVVVIGVAGTLYVRHGAEFTKSASAPALVASDEAPAPAAQPAPAPPSGGAATTGAGAAAGSAYGAGLLEPAIEQRPADREGKPSSVRRTRDDVALDKASELRAETVARAPAAEPPPPERKKQNKTAGIELRSPEPTPKDLDDSKLLLRKGEGRPAPSKARAPEPQEESAAEIAEVRSAPAKPVASSKVPPRAIAAAGAKEQVRDDPARPAAPSAAPPASTADGLSDDRDRSNDALLGWAKTKHDQVVAHVKSSNCSAAATAAVEIYNRAPDYYNANVASDRSVKPCLPYLTSERQREDRQRAAKRANANEAPAQAAPQQIKK